MSENENERDSRETPAGFMESYELHFSEKFPTREPETISSRPVVLCTRVVHVNQRCHWLLLFIVNYS